MNVKLLEDGMILNTNKFKISSVMVFDIHKYPSLKEFNNSLRELKYGSEAIYSRDSVLPLVKFGEYIEVNGYQRYIHSLDDFLEAIKYSKTTLVFNGIKFNKSMLRYIGNLLSTTPPYDIGFSLLSEHIESYIMLYEHMDSSLVLEDTLGITSTTILVNRSAVNYEEFSDYLQAHVHNITKELIDMGEKLYHNILTDVINTISDLHNHSIAIDISENRVSATLYASPVERRYHLAVAED